MPRLLTVLADLLFPPSADALLVRQAEVVPISRLYKPGFYKNVTFLTPFSDPLIQALIRENKFYHNKKAGELLGTILNNWPSAKAERVAFIPIPLGPKRFRDRGHNQVTTILKAAGLIGRSYPDLLGRTVETLPQSHLDKHARAKNIRQAFSFTGNSDQLQSYDRVVLIDDVVTTGVTLEAAAATLRPHLPPQVRLECLALAH